MGRPFNTTRPLGRLMLAGGFSVADVDAVTGISYRILSDYLAGRRPIKPEHAVALAAVLHVDVEDLTDDDVQLPEPVRTPTLYG